MHALQDTLLLFRRSVRHTFRSPEILVGITISPIMFVLMFRYVFGGAINIPGFDYVDFLMPGIFVQTLAFGALTTAISLAYDLEKGIVERFFTLPMSRSAIITGRTFADGLRAIFTVIVMVVVGVIVVVGVVIIQAIALGQRVDIVGSCDAVIATASLTLSLVRHSISIVVCIVWW